MKCAIAIFAKTIGQSPVKTRLAASIGRDKAEDFYRLSVKAIAEVMSVVQEMHKTSIQPIWTLAEEEAPHLLKNKKFPAIWTGEGNLGQRLANVSEQLFQNYDAVIFIGTDSPQLSPNRFLDAVKFLEKGSTDCVVGPAKDGGFYLFGSSQPISRSSWESVTYSVETTLDELIRHIKSENREIHSLRTEQDVDVLADLVHLKAEFGENFASLLPAQKELWDWVETQLLQFQNLEN